MLRGRGTGGVCQIFGAVGGVWRELGCSLYTAHEAEVSIRYSGPLSCECLAMICADCCVCAPVIICDLVFGSFPSLVLVVTIIRACYSHSLYSFTLSSIALIHPSSTYLVKMRLPTRLLDKKSHFWLLLFVHTKHTYLMWRLDVERVGKWGIEYS